jgi:hypothetical protein
MADTLGQLGTDPSTQTQQRLPPWLMTAYQNGLISPEMLQGSSQTVPDATIPTDEESFLQGASKVQQQPGLGAEVPPSPSTATAAATPGGLGQLSPKAASPVSIPMVESPHMKTEADIEKEHVALGARPASNADLTDPNGPQAHHGWRKAGDVLGGIALGAATMNPMAGVGAYKMLSGAPLRQAQGAYDSKLHQLGERWNQAKTLADQEERLGQFNTKLQESVQATNAKLNTPKSSDYKYSSPMAEEFANGWQGARAAALKQNPDADPDENTVVKKWRDKYNDQLERDKGAGKPGAKEGVWKPEPGGLRAVVSPDGHVITEGDARLDLPENAEGKKLIESIVAQQNRKPEAMAQSTYDDFIEAGGKGVNGKTYAKNHLGYQQYQNDLGIGKSTTINNIKLDAEQRAAQGQNNPAFVGADGRPLTGEAFLAKLPLGRAAQIRAFAEGRTTSLPRGKELLAFKDQVAQYDPEWSEQRAQIRKAFTTGADGRNIGALNTATVHMDQLSDAAKALKNGSFVPGNEVYNKVASWFGSAPPNNFNALKEAVAGEMANALKGNATDPEIAHISKTILSSGSPEQLAGVINTNLHTLGAKLNTYQERYRQQIPNDTVWSPVLPSARAVYDKHAINPTAGPQNGPPPPKAGQFDVADPRGVIHHFPNQAAADAFKKAAGIK